MCLSYIVASLPQRVCLPGRQPCLWLSGQWALGSIGSGLQFQHGPSRCVALDLSLLSEPSCLCGRIKITVTNYLFPAGAQHSACHMARSQDLGSISPMCLAQAQPLSLPHCPLPEKWSSVGWRRCPTRGGANGASLGEREKMGGVRCRFPIGLGQALWGGPYRTHVHLHPDHSPCSPSWLHEP